MGQVFHGSIRTLMRSVERYSGVKSALVRRHRISPGKVGAELAQADEGQ